MLQTWKRTIRVARVGYIGLRVATARVEEQICAADEKLADHNERLKRLGGVYIETD